MQLLTTICTICGASVLCACMLSTIYIITEFICLMIKHQPMAQALRTCARSFVESFPFMFAEAAAITLVSFLILSVI